ncbi:hypothetical protein ONE63_008210 [Megalurothrips usitatus]|uniref:Crossover junction endonuclease EME1 n=1 Tax=Megalurothrips usitatus TaxID=439358 RepID=A0AAV7XMY9_9NEOP|nr:hypothetical protein ONE63_008210 [Megalurothrips usitatus]
MVKHSEVPRQNLTPSGTVRQSPRDTVSSGQQQKDSQSHQSELHEDEYNDNDSRSTLLEAFQESDLSGLGLTGESGHVQETDVDTLLHSMYPQRKNVTPDETPRRPIRSSRKNKSRLRFDEDKSENEDCENEIIFGTSSSGSSSEEQPNKENERPSTQEPEANKSSGRRKPQKKIRKLTQVITEKNALPKFSQGLSDDLKLRVVDMNQVLYEIRSHIEQVTGDTYPTRKELALLCSATIKKEGNLAELTTELQGIVRDGERRKWLISRTWEGRGLLFQESDDKLDIISKYPHYKDSTMLIFEYQLSQNLSSVDVVSRTQTLLQHLGTTLDVELRTADDQMAVLRLVQKQLIPKKMAKQNIKLSITSKDTTEVDGIAGTLTTHEAQAPFIVCTLETTRDGKRALATSIVLMQNTMVSSMRKPSVADVLQQLLGAYFIFDLKYPEAYSSFLRLLEKYIHQSLSADTQSRRPRAEYKELIRQLPV